MSTTIQTLHCQGCHEPQRVLVHDNDPTMREHPKPLGCGWVSLALRQKREREPQPMEAPTQTLVRITSWPALFAAARWLEEAAKTAREVPEAPPGNAEQYDELRRFVLALEGNPKP